MCLSISRFCFLLFSSLLLSGGTESVRAGIFRVSNGEMLASASTAYETSFPRPGHAEQSPKDWYAGLAESVRGAISKASKLDKQLPERIMGLAVDTTCCTVVCLDSRGEPLRPSIQWMDSRAAPYAEKIMRLGRGDPFLQRNSAGQGPLSAEWMLPKALWLKTETPEVWKAATTVCEYQDFINFRLTGRMCCCNLQCATRWHWDTREAVAKPFPSGRPSSLLAKIGLSDLLEKWPRECVEAGQEVGKLTTKAAKNLGLKPGLR